MALGGRAKLSAFSAGQMAMQLRQPVHSAERMVMSCATGRWEGQALVHLLQSMQAAGSRRTFTGLRREARPMRERRRGRGIGTTRSGSHEGEKDEGEEDGDAGGSHVAEEVEHFDVGDDAEGGEEELLEGPSAERDGDYVDEEGEEQVLEAAQGHVEPTGKEERAVEELLAEVPEVFRGGPYGAEPGAEGFFEEEAREEEDDEEDHRGGVNAGDVVGGEEVLEVHEAGDGEPAFDTGRAADVVGEAVGFVEADPEIKLEAEPGVEGEEGDLDGVAEALGVVEEMAADEGFFWRAREFGLQRREER